jgi:hypothetical protein
MLNLPAQPAIERFFITQSIRVLVLHFPQMRLFALLPSVTLPIAFATQGIDLCRMRRPPRFQGPLQLTDLAFAARPRLPPTIVHRFKPLM